MNLILTDKCTNSCPYCFAALEMQRDKNKHSLSRADLDTFMAFVEREKYPIELNVIGGEPLIYSDLDYLFQRLYESEKISHFTVFTGGVVTRESILKLAPYRNKCDMLFNINEQDTYRNPAHYEKVVANLKYAILSGIPCAIGFNLYHHGFKGEQLIQLCKTYGVSYLRFSVACPVYGSHSSFVVPPQEYRTFADEVFDFLVDCHRHDIAAILDCPIPLCFFSDVQMGQLARIQPGVVSHMEKCHAALDINYNLKVFRCFSLSDATDVSLTDFNSFDDIRDYFAQGIDSRLQRPKVFEQCASCDLSARCNGGCLSNNEGFLNAPTKDELMKSVFENIQEGHVEEALQQLKSIVPYTVADRFLEAKLLLSLERVEEAKQQLYYCANNAHAPQIKEKAIEQLKSLEYEIL